MDPLADFHRSINHESSVDLDEVSRRLREITPGTDEMIERWENQAYDYHNELKRLGGRPSREVRPKPVYPKTYSDGLFHWFNEEEGAMEHAEPQTDLSYHWDNEACKFEDELARWRDFRKAQTVAAQDSSLRYYGDDIDLEQHEDTLRSIIEHLRDWRAFRSHQKHRVTNLARQKESSRGYITAYRAKHATGDPTIFGIGLEDRYNRLQSRIHECEKATKTLEWIKREFGVIADQIQESNSASMLQCLETKQREDALMLQRRLKDITGTEYWCFREPRQEDRPSFRILQWEHEMMYLADALEDFQHQIKHLDKGSGCHDRQGVNLTLSEEVMRTKQCWEGLIVHHERMLSRVQKWAKLWREYTEYWESEMAPGKERATWDCIHLNAMISRKYEGMAKDDVPSHQSKVEDARRGLAVFEASLDNEGCKHDSTSIARLPTPPDSASLSHAYTLDEAQGFQWSRPKTKSTPRILMHTILPSISGSKRKRGEDTDAVARLIGTTPASEIKIPEEQQLSLSDRDKKRRVNHSNSLTTLSSASVPNSVLVKVTKIRRGKADQEEPSCTRI